MTTETQATHTPGPWTQIDYGDGEPVIEAASGLIAIAIVNDYSDTAADWSPDVTQANARLIAAAPDLLAALEAILPQYMAFTNQGASNIHHQGDRKQYLSEHDARLGAGYAAVKLARGQ
jgi:hypothetical protein